MRSLKIVFCVHPPAGGNVLFTPGAADLDARKSPPLKRVPVFWNIQMTVRPPRNPTPKFDAMLGLLCDARHPALAKFLLQQLSILVGE